MQPSIPNWFEEALEREFRGRFRIRWSKFRREWHIEQRAGRAMHDLPRQVGVDTDRYLRARDGYTFFAAVQPRDTRPCPECHFPMAVPHLAFRESRCDYCGYKGKSGRLVLAYFPLGEKLLQHLRSKLPHHNENVLKEIDLHNERLELGMERNYNAVRQDLLRDGMAATHFATAGLPAKAKDFEAALLRRND